MRALRKMRQRDLAFEASLGYIEKPCLKKKEKKTYFKTATTKV